MDAAVANHGDAIADAAVLPTEVKAVLAHIVIDDACPGGGGAVVASLVYHTREKEERVAGGEIKVDASFVVLAFVLYIEFVYGSQSTEQGWERKSGKEKPAVRFDRRAQCPGQRCVSCFDPGFCKRRML